MTTSDHQFEFLMDVALLVHWCERQGYKITGGELYRPKETQELYVRQGKSKTDKGYHPRRLAIDLNLFIGGEYRTDSEAYRPMGEFWESLSDKNRWGGNFSTIKDGNHFERAI